MSIPKFQERHSLLRNAKTTTLTSSTPTSVLGGRRMRSRSGFAARSGLGATKSSFDFSGLGGGSSKTSFEASSFSTESVKNYRPAERAINSIFSGLASQRPDDDEEEEEDEDINPDDEIQIVIQPAKTSKSKQNLNDTIQNDDQSDDEEQEEEERIVGRIQKDSEADDDDEEHDILTELNVHRKGKPQANGSEKGGDSGSESAASQASSSLHTDTLSKRRKLGLSRMMPQAKNGSASISSINFAAHLQSDKSLFSDKNIASAGPSSLNASTTSLNSSLAPKRSFNAGLYGSMSALSDSRLLNIKSPYYNGPTMFGGASAYSQKPGTHKASASKLFRSNTGLPLMRPSSSLSSLSMLGRSPTAAGSGLERSTTAEAGGGSPKGTARRVLDLINQLNSPLEEIRKMASGSLLNESKRLPSLVGQRPRFGERATSAADGRMGVRLNAPRTPYSRQTPPQGAEKRSPLTTELQVPSMPQLLQMNKLQRSTEEIRKLAFHSRSGLNQETEYKLPGEESAKESVNKIKNKLNRMATRGTGGAGGGGGSSTMGGGAMEKEEEAVEVPKLPEIKFPEMKAMPRIDIKLPEEAKKDAPKIFNSTATAIASDERKKESVLFGSIRATEFTGFNSKGPTTINNSKSSPTARSSNFQFAAPIPLKSPATAGVLSPIKMNFVFSEPETATTMTLGGAKQLQAPVGDKPAAESPMFGAFKFNPGTAKVREGFSNEKSPLGEEKKDVVLKRGSVEDALGLAPKSNNSQALGSLAAPFGGAPLKPASTFGDRFKPAADTWSCSICMVRNKETDLKCLACATPKEAEKKAAAPLAPPAAAAQPADAGFKALIATQKSNKWECGACMLANEQSASKCVCCDTAKPGSGTAAAAAQSSGEAPVIKSSNPFAPPAGSSFAFGFKSATAAATPDAPKKPGEGFGQLMSEQNAKWECSTCMTRNEQSRSKCACCEQAKPGAAAEKVPQFSFGAVAFTPPASGAPAASQGEGFGKLMAEQSAKWECAACMTRNEQSRAKCVCCEQAKPGAAAASTTTAAEKAPQFAFGAAGASSKFSFGVPAAVAGDSKPAIPSGFQFGVSKPTEAGSADAPKFSFGMPAATAEKPKAAVEANAEEKKPAAASGGFKFGGSPAVEEPEKKKEPTEATTTGGFKFGMTTSSAATGSAAPAGGFSFGALKPVTTTTAVEVKIGEEALRSSAAAKPVPSMAFGGATATTFGSPAGGGVFGAKPTAPASASPAATEPKKIEVVSPIFGSAISSSAFGSKDSPVFGAKDQTPAKEPVSGFAANSTFAFGSAAAQPGSTSGNKAPPMFGGPMASSALAPAKPIVAFGVSAAAAPTKPAEAPQATFTFGAAAKKEEPLSATPVFGASITPAFGAGAPAIRTNSPFGMGGRSAEVPKLDGSSGSSLFGGAVSGAAPPAFGTSPSPAFGSSASPAFGPSSGTASPNLFGAKPAEPSGSLFGSPANASPFGGAQPNKMPAFGSAAPTTGSFDQSDGQKPAPFQFGAAAANPISNVSGGVARGKEVGEERRLNEF